MMHYAILLQYHGLLSCPCKKKKKSPQHTLVHNTTRLDDSAFLDALNWIVSNANGHFDTEPTLCLQWICSSTAVGELSKSKIEAGVVFVLRTCW